MQNKTTSKEDENSSNNGITAGVIVIGSIIGFDTQGRPLVDFNENLSSKPIVALSTLSLTIKNISRNVALLFNDGDLNQPVIMGLIHNPLDELLENFELTPTENISCDIEDTASPVSNILDNSNTVNVDGKQVCIEGAEEVSFKCGKASITLTKSGKILIRGTYLLNRSTGVNRIMGGSVQIN